MHPLNLRMPGSSSGISAGANWSSIPAGSRCWHAFSAALSWELPIPSCCALGNFALVAPVWGSGKFGTPWERTQRAKASSWEFADPPACVELPEAVVDGLPLLHAAAKARTAMEVTAAAVRAIRCRRCALRLAGVRVMACSVRGGPQRRGLSTLAGSP
jgi:hypothetical protein